MKLIVGLGNIGAHYDNTRHNVGFTALDALASKHALEWQNKNKYKALVAEGSLDGQKTMLAKPTTYYNLSGESVRAIKDFYKLENTDILIIHDELALPFGTVRTRHGGSDAGNNGIKSLRAHIGDDFARIRVGIANEHTPDHDASDFVLAALSHQERKQLPVVLGHVHNLVQAFVAGGMTPTTVK